MEFAFIVGIIGVWAIIALLGLGDKFRNKDGSHYEESDKDFLNRVARMNSENARKQLDEIKKQKEKYL